MQKGEKNMKLIGDIGATFSRIAIINQNNQIIYEEKYCNRKFSSFTKLLQRFLQGKKEKIQQACFGVAGPIRNQKVQMTNLQWTLDAKELQKTLSIPKIAIFNDMVLHAKGIQRLSRKEFFVLQKGKKTKETKRLQGNQLFIFPGTGLGIAFGILHGKKFVFTTSEAGHSDFSPRNPLEKEFYDFLQHKYGHVSYERVLSGPGVLDIYQFLLKKNPKAKKLHKPSSKKIVETGLTKKNALSEKVLDLFVSVYGAFVGNMALTIFPVSEIFLGGSITVALRKQLQEKCFLESVASKGRFSSLLKTIPIYVVLQEKTSFLGNFF
jgi:glucokinase